MWLAAVALFEHGFILAAQHADKAEGIGCIPAQEKARRNTGRPGIVVTDVVYDGLLLRWQTSVHNGHICADLTFHQANFHDAAFLGAKHENCL